MTHRLALIGAGRIGRVHAAAIADNPRAHLALVADVSAAAAAEVAEKFAGTCGTVAEALGEGIDAVLICSSTATHSELIERACAAGKPIFCEKPLDLDLARARQCAARVARSGVPLLMGFNRRFDPHFASLKSQMDRGAVGRVEMVQITSRDPAPPSAAYIRTSGGLFRDMAIHDFDMARWLLGEEPVEVYANGSALVDPVFGECGDIDSAFITLRTAGGRLCAISNSRRAVYGYDQRIEVHGSGGMITAANPREDLVQVSDAGGTRLAKLEHFFLERYAAAYRRELGHFLDILDGRASPLAGVEDGVRALQLAEAAQASLAESRMVRIA